MCCAKPSVLYNLRGFAGCATLGVLQGVHTASTMLTAQCASGCTPGRTVAEWLYEFNRMHMCSPLEYQTMLCYLLKT